MNVIFEEFVFESLRRRITTLAPGDHSSRHHPIWLDIEGAFNPEPDLSLWRDDARCLFVGDAKYKRTKAGEIDDVYQLLAYCVGTGLDEGLLIYAEAPLTPVSHRIVHGGPTIRTVGLDVSLGAD